MPMRASTASMASGSRKRPAGRMCDASSTTSTWPHASPIAAEALDRIGRLYGIEAEIRGRPPDERAAVRQARAGPELEALHAWLHATVTQLSKKAELAIAIRYALSRWTALDSLSR